MSFWTDRPTNPAAGPALRRVADLRLRGETAPLGARVYWPASPAQAAPALLVFFPAGHGEGGLDRADAGCRGLCAQAGVVVVSVTHRRGSYWAALHDAVAAVAWAADRGADLGADPERLLVAGAGAGGGFAAAVALRARDDRWPELLRQVLVAPCFANLIVPDDPGIAPFHRLSMAGVASATVITAEDDPRRDDGRRYAARLRRADVQVEELRYGSITDGPNSSCRIGATGRVLADLAGVVRHAVRPRAPPSTSAPPAATPAADASHTWPNCARHHKEQ